MIRDSRGRAKCVVLATIAAWGCASPTASCERATAVVGQWSYRATREAPVRGTINGSLVIESSNCIDLHGVMDVVEVLATGESRRIAGPVSGTVLDSALVRFEAMLSGSTREHFARLVGDSLTGTWLEIAGATSGSGPFSGHRQGGS